MKTCQRLSPVGRGTHDRELAASTEHLRQALAIQSDTRDDQNANHSVLPIPTQEIEAVVEPDLSIWLPCKGFESIVRPATVLQLRANIVLLVCTFPIRKCKGILLDSLTGSRYRCSPAGTVA